MFQIIIIAVAVSVAILCLLCDVNYFLRMIFTVSVGKLFQKKSGIKDTTSIYGELNFF